VAIAEVGVPNGDAVYGACMRAFNAAKHITRDKRDQICCDY
jgi:hypothetical protein